MPSSYPANIPVIVKIMETIRPQRCLDVGPGYGKYGFLFRERVDDFRWERRLDAFEPWTDYFRRSGAAYLYDHVYEGLFPHALSALSVKRSVDHAGERYVKHPPVPRAGWPLQVRYDLILMIDVLEHYDEEGGGDALRAALGLAPAVLVSTPLGYEQGPMYGNPHEEHKSEWPASRLEQYGRWHDYSHAATPDSVVGVLARA